MILIYLSIILKFYYFLNVFQKSFYEPISLFKLPLKKFLLLYLSTLFVIFSFFFQKVFLYIFLGITLFLQFLLLLKRVKVILSFTKRIIRLCITSVLMVLILSFILPIYVIDLIVLLIIILCDVINKPIEILIANYYLKKAQKKIEFIKSKKIAITGSFGKTSTKHYLRSVLKNKYLVKSSMKSYNTPLGLARFINSEEFNCVDFVIYEFGARRKGDIYELSKLFSYDIAIVTSIGNMHIDTFKNINNIIEEKMSICSYICESGFVVLNYENQYIRNYPLNKKKYTYGFMYGDYRAKNIKLSIFNSSFDLYINEEFVRNFNIKPLGRSAILNILPTIIFCDIYCIDYKYISKIEAVENRLSLRVIDNYYILDDAYNSNLEGAIYALEVLKTHEGSKFLITPGFVEMDLILEELAIKYAKEINYCCDMVFLVKNKFTLYMSKYIDVNMIFVDTFKKGFELFLSMKDDGSILLIENDLYE